MILKIILCVLAILFLIYYIRINPKTLAERQEREAIFWQAAIPCAFFLLIALIVAVIVRFFK